MKTTPEPILLVSSSYGIYSYQLLAEKIKYSYENYFQQMKAQIKEQDFNDLLAGPDNENYLDAFNDITNYITLELDGQKWFIDTNEDLWLCPAGFDFDEI